MARLRNTSKLSDWLRRNRLSAIISAIPTAIRANYENAITEFRDLSVLIQVGTRSTAVWLAR